MTKTSLLTISLVFVTTVYALLPEGQKEKNDNHEKNAPYVRTFVRYHHRRNIQYLRDDNDIWLETLIHDIKKRDAIPNPNSDFIDSLDFGTGQFDSEGTDLVLNSNIQNGRSKSTVDKNAVVSSKSINKVQLDGKVESQKVAESNYKVKAGVMPVEVDEEILPGRLCLYKSRISNNLEVFEQFYETLPANEQELPESDYKRGEGQLVNQTLPDGSVRLIQQCSDSRSTCYTLWLPGHNNTILGQGCWLPSGGYKAKNCDKQKCQSYKARNTDALNPISAKTEFCCCTQNYCNADFSMSNEYEPLPITPKAESTTHISYKDDSYWAWIAVFTIVASAAILLLTTIVKRIYRKQELNKDDFSDGSDAEKGDIMGSGQDSLATGILCVDNLTLIEHIGEGKFASVWRGTLGGKSVAVKLYTTASSWQKERAMYCIAHLHHPNLLQYYGADSRSTDSDGRRHLAVLELCACSLRTRLRTAPLSWREFARLARQLASALAHLHQGNGTKPSIVHRDVTSNNVLVTFDGNAKLADLGLAQAVPAYRTDLTQQRITEAGTMRYLAPEALEGALDLTGARAALCAVDVFALALVLWEMLWRTEGAHATQTPPYALPYAHCLQEPSLAQMQALVSRGKVRPPLPRGPVHEQRALKIASDTCEECWDHDAEARLTAVCVEERLIELEHLLQTQGPVIHDNHINNKPDTSTPQEQNDKNSNCLISQNIDVKTPLLYTQPYIGRNPCIERNTHTNTHNNTELIQKSLKDINQVIENKTTVIENCLSVARHNPRNYNQIETENTNYSEIRSYQRPLEYVQNDVSSIENDVTVETKKKQTNLLQEAKNSKSKWGFKQFFFQKKPTENSETNSKINNKPSNVARPPNLVLNRNDSVFNFEVPCTLSPPNRTLSANMLEENKVFSYKEIPNAEDVDSPKIFAVIVPKQKTDTLIELHGKNASSSDSYKTSIKSRSGQSESDDSTQKKRLSFDTKITANSANSSRASIELQYIHTPEYAYLHENGYFNNENRNAHVENGYFSNENRNAHVENGYLQRQNGISEKDSSEKDFDSLRAFENSDSSSEDENIMLLSENGSKITMQPIPKNLEKHQNEVLKEACLHKLTNKYNPKNGYTHFDNELSDPNDKENFKNVYSGDNPLYLAAIKGEIDMTADLKIFDDSKTKNVTIQKDKNGLTVKENGHLEKRHSYSGRNSDYCDGKNRDSTTENGYPNQKMVIDKTVNELQLKNENCFLLSKNGNGKNENGQQKNETDHLKNGNATQSEQRSPKPAIKYLTIKRQHSLEQVNEIFSSSGDLSYLQNPAGRVKTPGDLPAAVRRARRDKVLKKTRNDSNRLSLYDDRMMSGNSL